MSEKVLGTIRLKKAAFARLIDETLFFTSNRVIVARTSGGFGGMLFGAVGAGIETAITTRKAKKKEKEYRELSLESVLKADKHNFAIPNSEITKVELKSRGRFHITTSKKKHKWTYWPEKKEGKVVKLEDYEDILRPIFGDKLSTK